MTMSMWYMKRCPHMQYRSKKASPLKKSCFSRVANFTEYTFFDLQSQGYFIVLYDCNRFIAFDFLESLC